MANESTSTEPSPPTSDPTVENPSSSTMNGDASPRSRSFKKRSMAHSNGDLSDPASVSPFDVENGGLRTTQSMAKLEMLEQSVHGSVDPVVVFKTVFYILVWYTFSTCLTLYNKTLLGDKLGKFPAPLLMNTFHFTLQAILSKIIVFVQSRKDTSNVIMSWKDYFIRGTHLIYFFYCMH